MTAQHFSAQLATRELGYRRYEVDHTDGRRWRVQHNVVTRRWDIVNRRTERVFEFGRLGLAILEVCEAEAFRLGLDDPSGSMVATCPPVPAAPRSPACDRRIPWVS